MRTSGESIGRAIDPGSAPPSSPQKPYALKEEPVEGGAAAELARSASKGLRIISSSGGRLLYSRDQSEIPRFLKEIMF
jgi:hypothetical protein